MHELPVTEQLLEIVLEHARKAKARRVTKVNLVIGALAGFTGECVQFYFDMLSRETEAEGASLLITQTRASARCGSCGHRFHPEGMAWDCPCCGGPVEEITGGREFFLESIDVE